MRTFKITEIGLTLTSTFAALAFAVIGQWDAFLIIAFSIGALHITGSIVTLCVRSRDGRFYKSHLYFLISVCLVALLGGIGYITGFYLFTFFAAVLAFFGGFIWYFFRLVLMFDEYRYWRNYATQQSLVDLGH